MVQIGDDVVTELRNAAVETAEIIEAGGGKPYDPGDEQNDAPYLTVQDQEIFDTEVVDVLQAGASLDLATDADLHRRLAFYAVLLGNGIDDRSKFVKAQSPVKLARKTLYGFFDDALRRVDYPLLALSPGFDVVITPNGTWALNQSAFERLFKDTEIVTGKVGEWVQQISEHVPISAGCQESFSTALRSNSYLRRKVQSIIRQEYFKKLTTDELKATMTRRGLNPDEIMPNGELVLTKDNQKNVLNLLNDDLFTGDFSKDQYAAGRKERRSQLTST